MRTSRLKLVEFGWVSSVAFLAPHLVFAAGLEGSLRNLVTAITGRLLPILSLGYLAKNIFGHIQGDPNARQETARVVIAIVCLLGLSSVWSFLSQQVR